MSDTITRFNALLNQRYELLGVIGTGQYGTAWKARCRADGGTVCLKRIPFNHKDDHTGALQEAQLLSRLEHPNIISYVDSFLDSEGALCIVTTYCEDGDLFSKIRSRKSEGKYFTEAEVMDTFIQIASALLYIHSQRVLHRDLKSQNIFLKSNGIVMLGDFGICKVLEKTDAFATTVTGTPYYMAPEVCTNKPYTYKSDIWSLGCVLYELCTLTHAFAADSLLSLVYQIVRGSYPPVPGEMFSSGMIELVGQLLTSEASERPSLQQVLASAYVREHIQRFNADEKRRILRKQSSLIRRPGVHLAASSMSCEPNEETGSIELTPKQRIALKREEQRRRRELELQVATLSVSKDRQEVARRKQTQLASNSLTGILPVPTQIYVVTATESAATASSAVWSSLIGSDNASCGNQQDIGRPATSSSLGTCDRRAGSTFNSSCDSFVRPNSSSSNSPRSRLAAGQISGQQCQLTVQQAACFESTSTRPRTAYEEYEERPVGTSGRGNAQSGTLCYDEDDDCVNLATMPAHPQPEWAQHSQYSGETSTDSDSVLLGSVVHQQQPQAAHLLDVSWQSADMQHLSENARCMHSAPKHWHQESTAGAEAAADCMAASQRAASAPGSSRGIRYDNNEQQGPTIHHVNGVQSTPTSNATTASCVGEDGVVRFGSRSNGQTTTAFDFVLQRAASDDDGDATAKQPQHIIVQQMTQHTPKTGNAHGAAAAAGSAARYDATSSEDYEADFEHYEADFEDYELEYDETDEQLLAEVEQRKKIRETIAQLSKSFTGQNISTPSSPVAQPTSIQQRKMATGNSSSCVSPTGNRQQPQQPTPHTLSACQAALGDQFDAVHQYLLQVHRGAANAGDVVRGDEVKQKILVMVGSDKAKQEACFSLEQLVFRAVLAGS